MILHTFLDSVGLPMSHSDAFEECPHCGAELPPSARFCRECGADETVGWNDPDDHPDDDAGDDFEDDFDYDEYLRREFPDQAPPRQRNPIVLLLIVLLLLGLAVSVLV